VIIQREKAEDNREIRATRIRARQMADRTSRRSAQPFPPFVSWISRALSGKGLELDRLPARVCNRRRQDKRKGQCRGRASWQQLLCYAPVRLFHFNDALSRSFVGPAAFTEPVVVGIFYYFPNSCNSRHILRRTQESDTPCDTGQALRSARRTIRRTHCRNAV
jgi:hypothetical protein